MNEVANRLFSLLEKSGVKVCHHFPDSYRNMPLITYYELSKTPVCYCDDGDYLSCIEFIVEIWHKDPLAIETIYGGIKELFLAEGFYIVHGTSFFEKESGLFRKRLRLRINV